MSAKPSLRTRLRPVELLVMAAIIGVFVGVIVLMGTREPLTSLVFGGVAFVAALVVIAMLLLAVVPPEERPGSQSAADGRPDGERRDEDGPVAH